MSFVQQDTDHAEAPLTQRIEIFVTRRYFDDSKPGFAAETPSSKPFARVCYC